MTTPIKAINITAANAKKIEAALAAVNGRATSHTFTTYAAIEQVATILESKLDRLGIAKKYRAGASGTATSGDSVAKAYRHARNVTDIRLERRSSAWFLVAIGEATAYAEGSLPRLALTKAQDALAVANLRDAYSIKVPQAVTDTTAV
jgi:hypothetical protein